MLKGIFSSERNLAHFLTLIPRHLHGSTHEIPLDRFKAEGLKPINGVPEYLVIREEARKISRECFISYLGNMYSAPYRFAGREATLNKSGQSILKFETIEVEKRPLSVYDSLIEG